MPTCWHSICALYYIITAVRYVLTPTRNVWYINPEVIEKHFIRFCLSVIRPTVLLYYCAHTTFVLLLSLTQWTIDNVCTNNQFVLLTNKSIVKSLRCNLPHEIVNTSHGLRVWVEMHCKSSIDDVPVYLPVSRCQCCQCEGLRHDPTQSSQRSTRPRAASLYTRRDAPTHVIAASHHAHVLFTVQTALWCGN